MDRRVRKFRPKGLDDLKLKTKSLMPSSLLSYGFKSRNITTSASVSLISELRTSKHLSSNIQSLTHGTAEFKVPCCEDNSKYLFIIIGTVVISTYLNLNDNSSNGSSKKPKKK